MSNRKSFAMAALMAASVAFVGSSAFAGTTTPTSTKEMRAQCEKDAKAKGLSGEALKAAEKKCHDEYKTKK